MAKILKVSLIILFVLAVGWSIPKFFIKDDTGILDDHIVVEGTKGALSHPLDKILLLKTKVSSGVIQFNVPSTIYIDAYTWFGIKYATVQLDCLKGMFFSHCSGVVVK